MTDKEKKAIDYLQLCYDLSTIDNKSLPKLATVLNLIEKQQKEIKIHKDNFEELSKDITQVLKDLGLSEETIIADEMVVEIKKKFVSKDKIRENQMLREFELQQEYKDFEDDEEWKTYNKLLGGKDGR